MKVKVKELNIELKTLKDIDIHPCGGNYCHSDSEETLRREAIKWVKSMEKDLDKDRVVIGSDTITVNGSVEVKRCFMMFFNLTEDDLK